MGILSSFNIGVTGLHASGSSMSVIGDNIANSNTFGFKSSRAEFQDQLARSLTGIDGGDQIGTGAKLAHVKPNFTQGNVMRTENITDMAMDGNGFFVAETPFGQGFTRDGSFQFDKEGNLTTGDGYKIKGFQADDSGEISNKVGNIRLGNTTIPASASKKVKLSMNLDSRAKVQQFNPTEPDKTSNFNTSITVYDNIGTARMVTMYFNKSGPNNWEYHAMVNGGDAAGGKEGTMVEMAKGNVKFSDKGLLDEEVKVSNAFNFSEGAAPGQVIEFDFGQSLKEGGDGTLGSTQYGSSSTVARHSQDGFSAATLASLSFSDDAVLTAVYNNGVTKDIAQVAVAKFDNNEGLFKTGKNFFKETKKSGQGVLGKPGKDGRGMILSKSIEQSNVDIATEFINLMTAQRNFQANTRTISTSDQMLNEVFQIKR